MKSPNLRGRYLRILSFFAGVIFRFIFWELIIRHLGLRSIVRRTRSERFRKDAMRFRTLAIHMGGVMIKVGQFLSSRLDVLPPEITDTLADLQDEVPAESFDDIRHLAEKELGAPLAEKFERFDAEPLAAASLGQVHRARLKVEEGEDFLDVVVKVQRPNIEAIVEVDLSALQRVGNWLMRYRPIREHADVPALLREFSSTVREEIDYMQEAKNAQTFHANFKDNHKVRVPRVIPSLSTLRVLTLEDVYAIKITDYELISAAGIDRGEVARRLLDTYLEQIFEDGFFHADPHPGNLFVTPIPPKKGGRPKLPRWQLTFVDFGMVGHVPENLREGLRETVVGVGTRDAARLIKSYQSLGFLLPGADTQALEQASAAVFDRFWGMSMSDLRNIRPSEVRDIGHRVRDVMVEMPFQVPNDLLMLLRTVAILSGMCTGLDPNFNLWEQLEPYASKLVTEEASSAISLDSVLDQLGEIIRVLVALPSQTSRILAQIESGKLSIQIPQIKNEVRHFGRSVDRLTGGVIFSAFLISGVMLLNAGNEGPGGVLLGVAGLTLLLVIFSRRGGD
jgi:predicted unusual protein kinase regulating ubiquinone biosynthesis (AarF/ABC1/UbiB family)